MADFDSHDQDPDPLQSTAEVIEAARRPLLVARHKQAVNQALASLSDDDLAAADEDQTWVSETLSSIADDDSLHTADLAEGLLEYACMAREHGEMSDEQLPQRLAGVYARVRKLLSQHQDGQLLPIEDLATLPCNQLSRLLNPIDEQPFGSPQLAESLVYTNSQASRCLDSIRLIARGEGADQHWQEAAGDPPLTRDLEEPLEQLPEEERRAARDHLVRDRIRHRFFKKVFLVYFDRDTLDPQEIAAHATILDWLEAIADTPHLFPFMQGQTTTQKIFRLRQLWRKIIQLNELYQRVAIASNHPSYRERFSDLGTRERLRILAEDRYPALKVDHQFSLTTARCPFAVFARWIQDKVVNKDFVLPPEPKRPSAGGQKPL